MAGDEWRLFVALPLSREAALACASLLADRRERHAGARWIPVEYLHLTLVFLGGVPEGQVPRIISRIDPVAVGHRPIDLAITSGSGRARRGDDGVAWLSLDHGAPEAAALAAALHAALADWVHPTREGPPGGRPAGERPHVTVARRASRALIAEMADLRAEPPVTWRAESVVLFRSHLGPPGARYVQLHESPLGERRGRPSTTTLGRIRR